MSFWYCGSVVQCHRLLSLGNGEIEVLDRCWGYIHYCGWDGIWYDSWDGSWDGSWDCSLDGRYNYSWETAGMVFGIVV